jgi:hypothetical protein
VSPALEPTRDQPRRQLAVLPPTTAQHRESNTARCSPGGEHPRRFLVPTESRRPGEDPQNEERTTHTEAQPRQAVEALERPGQAVQRLRRGRAGHPPYPTA